jgi:hypothetical protein
VAIALTLVACGSSDPDGPATAGTGEHEPTAAASASADTREEATAVSLGGNRIVRVGWVPVGAERSSSTRVVGDGTIHISDESFVVLAADGSLKESYRVQVVSYPDAATVKRQANDEGWPDGRDVTVNGHAARIYNTSDAPGPGMIVVAWPLNANSLLEVMGLWGATESSVLKMAESVSVGT